MSVAPAEYLLFVYGTLLAGEESHGLLEGAKALGPSETEPLYSLVDLGTYPGMIAGGDIAVKGELYGLDAATLARVDVHEGHPVLFKRGIVKLAGGREVQGYLLDADQVRGRRRIRSGSWKDRFAKPVSAFSVRDAAFVRWSRTRPR